MSYTFLPPTYTERPQTGVRLIDAWLKVTRGISVLKSPAGVYTQATYPTTDDIRAAAIFYQGGHVYTVSDAEAALLTTAGYATNLTLIATAATAVYDVAVYDVAIYG